jgi:peptidyl-prolyl cis-trans isomerase A (cyclophilin A)
MPLRLPFLAALVSLVTLGSVSDAHAQTPLPQVRITTEVGEFVVEVDTVRAPISGSNFLRYVDGGFYEGGVFHRTVTPNNQPNDSIKIAVIQGNISRERWEETDGPIPLERTSLTGIRHTDGVLSMARSGPDTAVASFFICVGDQPELDFGGKRNPDGQGFAAFGRVISGMEVVRRINNSPAEDQSLTPLIGIRWVERVEPGQE